MLMFDLPRFLMAGTAKAASSARIEMTTSNSSSVKALLICDLRFAIEKEKPPDFGNRQSAIGNRQSVFITSSLKHCPCSRRHWPGQHLRFYPDRPTRPSLCRDTENCRPVSYQD